jgi:hypothetical protein
MTVATLISVAACKQEAHGHVHLTLNSDDGSVLWIDGNMALDNGGAHGPLVGSNDIQLTAGTHSFEIHFFECCGGPSGVDLVLLEGGTYVYCGDCEDQR